MPIARCVAARNTKLPRVRQHQGPIARFAGQACDVAAGVRPGRESDDELTFFKSVGLAVQDMAAAALRVTHPVGRTPATAGTLSDSAWTTCRR